MTIAVVTVGVLVGLGSLLWTVYRLKPARFHIKVSITKWVFLDIPMQTPRSDASSGGPRQRRRRRPRR
jgi:hypothetical protein